MESNPSCKGSVLGCTVSSFFFIKILIENGRGDISGSAQIIHFEVSIMTPAVL